MNYLHKKKKQKTENKKRNKQKIFEYEFEFKRALFFLIKIFDFKILYIVFL